ncbi:pilus assembly PilX family protein [Acinetobacter terrae]|uniref:Pilus assembly protein PilX n=1 Tax=Acinetobacter terrae TaxID=2731247 RepID=A0A8E4GM40_9GAMM|nr:PilX N-terminal domain-containing pilus assembly protein [Acinetobacter terrae]NNH38060.1 pilus assembly protein PilX [Acinetobacter terrae]
MNKNSQRGATLIVVLILLVMVTVIGTLAIRQSVMSLNIATNAQVQQLLTQNSDSALLRIEDQNNVVRNLARDGMFGYIRGVANKNKELVFCYRADQAKSNFFKIQRASIVEWRPGDNAPRKINIGTEEGFCKSSDTSANFFTSGRKAVMTQVSVKFSSIPSEKPFQHSTRGTYSKSAKIEETEKVNVYSVSLMPNLSSASASEIDNCLSLRMNEVSEPETETVVTGITPASRQSLTACLTGLSIPFTTQVSEYTIVQAFS